MVAAWQRSQRKLVDLENPDSRRFQQLLNHYAATGRTGRWRSAATLLGNFARHRELQPELQLFNSLINVCGKSSRWCEALRYFQLMGHVQLEISSVTYNTVLSLDLKDAWPRAWHLLPHADLLGCNAALGGCGAWGAWQRAEGLMRSMNHLQPDVVTYVAVMKSQQKAKLWQNAADMLQGLRNLRPTVLCWSVAAIGPWHEALGNVQLMRSQVLASSVVTLSAVITSLAESATGWKEALQILADAPLVQVEPNVISYNASICACSTAAEPWRKALELVPREANLVTFNSAISACSAAGEWQWAMVLLKELELRNLQGDSFTLNAAIACEARWTEALELLRLADAARLADVISYSSCISALEKALQWQKALELFFLMTERTISPNLISCNAAISACEKCGVWQLALLLLAGSHTLRLQLDVISFNASLSACENASEWEHALALLAELHGTSLRATSMTYNVAMSACSRPRWRKVVMLQQEMRHQALDLNLITFNVASVGDWQRCCRLWEEISLRHLEADALTFQKLLKAMEEHLPGIPKVLADLKRTALLFHAQRSTASAVTHQM